MNFDFSDDQKQMRDAARKFLSEQCPPKAVRAVLDGKAAYDKELWKGLAEMGFLGVAIPEEFGGAGAGAFLLDGVSCRRSVAARRLRRAEEEVAAEDRERRGHRHAGAVRRQ